MTTRSCSKASPGCSRPKTGFEVSAKCSSGTDALRAIRELRPDVAVLDIVMPDMSGLDVLARINSEGLRTRVVFLTANATDTHILALIEKGASALLVKDIAINEVARCVKSVAEGTRFFPTDLVNAALERETGRRSVGEQFRAQPFQHANAKSHCLWRKACRTRKWRDA